MSRVRSHAARSLALFVIMITILGCSGLGVPSQSDAEKVFTNTNNSIKQGRTKLTSFNKTNGQQGEVFGVKVYQLEYAAELEWTQDEVDLYGHTGNLHRKGDIEKTTGSLQFEKTERGWKGQDGAIY